MVNKDVGKFFSIHLARYTTEFNGVVQIMPDPNPSNQCTNLNFPVEDQENTIYYNILVNYAEMNGLDLEK